MKYLFICVSLIFLLVHGAEGDYKTTLTWSAKSQAQGYYVYTSTNSLASKTPVQATAMPSVFKIGVSSSTLKYEVWGLSGGTSYYFRVSYFTSVGENSIWLLLNNKSTQITSWKPAWHWGLHYVQKDKLPPGPAVNFSGQVQGVGDLLPLAQPTTSYYGQDRWTLFSSTAACYAYLINCSTTQYKAMKVYSLDEIVVLDFTHPPVNLFDDYMLYQQ